MAWLEEIRPADEPTPAVNGYVSHTKHGVCQAESEKIISAATVIMDMSCVESGDLLAGIESRALVY
jgi:hypothetical protein